MLDDLPAREDEPAGRARGDHPDPRDPHRAEEGPGEGQVRRHRAGDLHRRGPGEARRGLRRRAGAGRRAAVVGGRRGRRGDDADGEGAADADRHDRVPRRRLRVRALRAVLEPHRLQEPAADRPVLREERARHPRRRPARALGLGVGPGDRQPHGLRLRRDARLPPRRTSAPTGWATTGWLVQPVERDPQVQLHRRHPHHHRRGGRQADRRRGGAVVDIEMRGTNQRGEVTCPGTATIALPSREHGDGAAAAAARRPAGAGVGADGSATTAGRTRQAEGDGAAGHRVRGRRRPRRHHHAQPARRLQRLHRPDGRGAHVGVGDGPRHRRHPRRGAAGQRRAGLLHRRRRQGRRPVVLPVERVELLRPRRHAVAEAPPPGVEAGGRRRARPVRRRRAVLPQRGRHHHQRR